MPDHPTIITLSAPIELRAAAGEGKPKRLYVLAYSGAKIQPPGWGPVVVDLAGMKLEPTVTLLADHTNKLDAIIGTGPPKVEKSHLTVVATLAASDAARQVVALIESGTELQASIGAEPVTTSFIRAGEKATVNKQTIEGPFTLVSSSRLREISVVPAAADSATSVRIAARLAAGAKQMSDPILSENVTDPVAEERARVAEIDTIAANHAAIRKQAITAGWSPGETELTILRAEKERHELQTLRDSRPCGITGARGTAGPDVNNSDLLASALLLHAGKASLAEKHFGPKAAQAGDDLRARSLIDIFANAITLAGHTVPRTTEKIIAAAFSTFDMPIAVESATQKIALDQYKTTPASWRAFCRIADVKNFKPTALVRPIFAGGFNDVAPGGELHHGNMEEEATSIKAKTGGKLLILDRTSIVNDDLQVLFGAAEALGRDAARWISDLVYTCLLDNLNPAGDPFFSVGAGNLLDGASYAFSKESLAIAVAAMLARVDSKGRNIDLTPKTIVYPVALDEAVREVLNSTLIARDTSDTDSLPMGNAMYQRVTPVAEPRLGNTAFHANASDLHWFLFASPADGPVTVAFLNGQDSPIIEQAQLPPENLGLAWRGYADAGCSLTDGRACLMSLGEAS